MLFLIKITNESENESELTVKNKLKNEKLTRCCSKLFIVNINTSAIDHDDTGVNEGE